MAGSLAFYSGMTPGISRMVSSIADDTAYNKGYALQANSMHDMASARKADADALKIRHEITSGDDAAINHVLGTYNLTKPEFDAFKAARTNGTPLPAGTNEGPGFSQGQIERYNNALRDHAAMMTRKPHDVSQFATQMAQLPAVQASVDAARRGDSKSASEIMMNQAALGKDVMQDHNSTDVKTWNWLQSQPPAVQKAYTANQIAMRQAGATSVNNMTPVEMVDPATGNKVYGYPQKNGSEIKATSALVPPKGPEGPQSGAGKILSDQRKGFIPGAPASAQPGQGPVQSAAPAGLPAGSKKVGTSKGKDVYEAPDGKRYLAE